MAPTSGLESKMASLAATLATLALLSVAGHWTADASPLPERHCYECGPLAEQPHRSARPPPCDEPAVVLCDAGSNYCATIATLKVDTATAEREYTLSKICVKAHKEDCYQQYCNTSNTWRMTCTCETELCNGGADERTQDAFNRLVEINTTNVTTILPTSTAPSINKGTEKAAAKQEATAKVTDNTTKIEDNTIQVNQQNKTTNATVTQNEEEIHHPLPVPAALGGEQQSSGAPVDDEEDTSEGSGRGMDTVKTFSSQPDHENKEFARKVAKDTDNETTTTRPQHSSADILATNSLLIVSTIIFSAHQIVMT